MQGLTSIDISKKNSQKLADTGKKWYICRRKRTNNLPIEGNGRVGRLLLFKECLANGITPFIITDELKMFYYRGLKEWGHQRVPDGYLPDGAGPVQDITQLLQDCILKENLHKNRVHIHA